MAAANVLLTLSSNVTGATVQRVCKITEVKKVREAAEADGWVITGSRVQRAR